MVCEYTYGPFCGINQDIRSDMTSRPSRAVSQGKKQRAVTETEDSDLAGWLKGKARGKEKSVGPVDPQFLADLSDVKKVGRYEIVKKLGQGSMGVVYHGRDP
jgi:serine/threonine protein kinase